MTTGAFRIVLHNFYPGKASWLRHARKESEVPTSIAFDIYGTLVNPLAITEQLRLIGDQVERFA